MAYRFNPFTGRLDDVAQGVGAVTGSGTATEVAYWGTASTITSDSGLFWNPASKRLGVGLSTPQAPLHVLGVNGAGEGLFAFTHPVVAAFHHSDAIGGQSAFVSLMSGTLGTAGIYFGDKDQPDMARWEYNNANAAFSAYVDYGDRILAINRRGEVQFANIASVPSTSVDQPRVNISTGSSTVPSLTGFSGRTLLLQNNIAVGDDVHLFLLSGTSGEAGILFGDTAAIQRGIVQYDHAGDHLKFGTAATERFRIGSAGQWGIGGATYGTAGQAFLSGGAGAAPTWGAPAPAVHNHENAAGGGQLDHGLALTGLSDDDHSQYLLRAGRTGTTNDATISTSGNGTLLGSTAATGNLILSPRATGSTSINDAAASSRVEVWRNIVFMQGSGETQTDPSWVYEQSAANAITWNSTNHITQLHRHNTAVRYASNLTIGSVPINDCNSTATKTAGTADTLFTNFIGYEARHCWIADGGARTTPSVGGYVAAPSISRINAGTGTATRFYGFITWPYTLVTPVGAGCTATDMSCYLNGAIGAQPGTVTSYQIFDAVDDVAVGSSRTVGFRSRINTGTNKWSLYFDGTADSTFGGKVSFGSVTAPGSTVDIFGDLGLRVTFITVAAGTNINVGAGSTDRSVFRVGVSSAAAFTINGIANPGRAKFLIIFNVSGQQMTIADQSGVETTAANRIICPGGANWVGNATGTDGVILWYDGTSSRWRLVDR